jgi:D-3-phosphoglycerate dehydrogenase / 2-oxoglutarate reductase
MNQQIIIIDFDSTFTKVEALDELANIALQGKPNQAEVVAKITEITNKGMSGEMQFHETLQQRIALLQANKNDIEKLVAFLLSKISDSFIRNKKFIEDNAEHIYIVSGGFKEYITPIVTTLGVKPNHIYANEFIFDDAENIIGFDENNLLSQDKGKVKLLQQLNLQGDVCIIGDGYTDYQLREAGLANTFYMFTENVERESLLPKADEVITNLDEFLYLNNLSRSQSYPKTKIKVLLLENIHANALQIFQAESFQIETISGALDEAELIEKIKDVQLLCIRSKTQVTEKVLQHANKLMTIGAFCIGTNQIDLQASASKGIVVFNAPYSNTRSVVELAIGEIIMLMRNVVSKSNLLHAGVWDKSAKNSFEIRGKILGIVGYGNIGTQLSVLAEALGMQVIFFDTADKLSLGNARKCNTLEELLHKADIVSMHVDGRESNHHLIGKNEFAMMKDNVIFLNLSRGHIVDLEAMQQAISSGKIWGAGVDVYPYEPKTNDEEFVNSLRNLPNTIITPHIGGSTEEAQANIGEYVPYKMINYINKGDTYGSVNFPEVQLPSFANSHRLLHIHKNTPGILAKLNAVFAKYNVNIQAQFLKTNEDMGYVITDVESNYNQDIVQEIKAIDGTVKFRMLY